MRETLNDIPFIVAPARFVADETVPRNGMPLRFFSDEKTLGQNIDKKDIVKRSFI